MAVTSDLIPTRKQISEFAFWKWEGTFEKWSRSWVRKNYWRVRHIAGSQEDALSICQLLFVECVHRYGDKIDNNRWLMSLYSRMVINHWNRLSVLDNREREMVVFREDVFAPYMLRSREHEPVGPDPFFLDNERTPSNAGLIDIKLSMSDEIRRALTILMEAPSEIIDILFEGKNEEADSAAIRRFCGIKSDINVLEEIRRALGGKMSRSLVLR